ncbi:hypothetical protein K438DRAFT_1970540 [Mycena galopus ATCC 62051]|nr:hypothetical protein K438DRAFT_1970540 [Mycena galopus ATCC 62051]
MSTARDFVFFSSKDVAAVGKNAVFLIAQKLHRGLLGKTLEKTNRFSRLSVVAVTEAVRESLPFDYEFNGGSREGSEEGYGDSEDEDEDFDVDFEATATLRSSTFNSARILALKSFTARPAVCGRLMRFTAGDPSTGNGGYVRHEAAFIRFVRLCPNMRVFQLDVFTSLSDIALAIFELTDHDYRGNVSGMALKTLARTPSLAPTLKALYLLDQRDSSNAVKELSKARPTLWMFTGETLGNSMSAQLLATEAEGEADTQTWLGGKIGYW